ncbi:hypothetical protein GGR58DRAFT_515500 [Xylaria digitata]|nr:hypothetical protein GGR58DRAFT_515500 [Xylaria digitata]
MSLESQSQQHVRYTRIRVHDENDFRKLYPLIIDYTREPELALSVKEFVFCVHTHYYEYGLRPEDHLAGLPQPRRTAEFVRDISQEHAISQLVAGLGFEEPEKSDWVRILTWMKPELVAAREEAVDGYELNSFYRQRTKLFAHYTASIFLMICPNIEILKLEEGSRIAEPILRRNNYGLFPATHLQKLRHSVSTDGVGPGDDGGYVGHFAPANSNLKRTHVGHAIYGTDVIGPLIRAPKRLEEFAFTTGGRCNLEGGYTLRAGNTISKALHEHKSSLRKIDIDIDEHIGGEEDENALLADDEITDWDDRDECIGIGLLLGRSHEEAPFRLIDALPKSLEYLLIQGYKRGVSKGYDSQIDEFLLLKGDRLPLLTKVHGIDKMIPIAESIDFEIVDSLDTYDSDDGDSDDDDEDDNGPPRLWRPESPDDEWEEELS